MLSSKSATDATASMSSLLLQGWAMQAQSCLECKVPLMRKRGQDDTFCVNCKKTFDKDGKPKGGEQAAAPGGAVPPQAKSDTHWLSGMGNAPAHAPATAPAQPDPSSRSTLDAFRAMRQQAGIPEPSEPAAPQEAEEKPDPSEELAAKMLEGWALLGIHCPRCGQPLVRNKEGKMWCVGCSVWVLTQEQAQAAEAAKKARAGPTPAPPPPVQAAEKPQQQPQQQPAKEPSGMQRQVGEASSRKPTSTEGETAAQPSSNPRSEPAAAAAALAPDSIASEAMSNAVSALTAKLNEAAQELKSIPVTHASSCFQYVQLIRECSGALGELHELNAKHQRLG